MGIHKSRTTAYHHQCDGAVERQNCTLQDVFSLFLYLSTGPTGTCKLIWPLLHITQVATIPLVSAPMNLYLGELLEHQFGLT